MQNDSKALPLGKSRNGRLNGPATLGCKSCDICGRGSGSLGDLGKLGQARGSQAIEAEIGDNPVEPSPKSGCWLVTASRTVDAKECFLGDVIRQIIPSGHAKCDGTDDRLVAMDESGQGVHPAKGKPAHQFCVGRGVIGLIGNDSHGRSSDTVFR